MNISGAAARFSTPRSGRQILVFLLFATWPQHLPADQVAEGPAPSYTQQTPEQSQQLVAPIALYPDSLVAQILTASTFPEQVVEADRWLQAHPDLQGDALAEAVDQQLWDPSVKALTAFPSVLGNMDKNLSWTSSLGDAYYNQPEDVMDAIQVMRQRAQEAGTLKTTPQETLAMQDSTIAIEPSNPDTVYVPAYDPWQAYGDSINPWPNWYAYPGIWYDGPGCWFGAGLGIGFFGHFRWGWHHWGCDWHDRFVTRDHNKYDSPSTTFYNRRNFYRGSSPAVARDSVARGLHPRANSPNMPSNANVGERASRVPEDLRQNMENRPSAATIGTRGGVYNRFSAEIRPFNGNMQGARGYGEPRGESGVRSSAFSGYNSGGETRIFSSRGSTSFGGGGHVGGGHAGGGRSR